MPQLSREKFIAYVPVGDAQSTHANPRAVNLPRAKEGIFDFNDLVDGPLTTLFKNGFRRFLIWQPFGLTYPSGCHSNDCLKPWKFTLNGIKTDYVTPQCVDDYLNLIDLDYAPYQRMVDTFVPAIMRFKRNHTSAEIIIYNGTSLGNPRFNSLSSAQIVARLNAALDPIFETHCHFAFDSACMIPPDHWLAHYYAQIDKKGLHVYVEAAPWRYEYLKTRGFVCSLEQLRNVTPESCKACTPTKANKGFVGFLDPAEVMGERIGCQFQPKPPRFATALEWLSKIVPRVFNSGQIDALLLTENPFLGPPYAPQEIRLEDLIDHLEKTEEHNYPDYLV